MEEDPSERNVARYSRAEEAFARPAATRAESEARAMAAGLGLAGDRLDLPIGVLSRRRAAAGRAGPHPVRRQRRAAARRADQPPRRRRQGVAAGVPAHVPRRAAGDQPRPRPARRGDHPRAAPRPPAEDAVGELVEYKGTYTQYRAARPRTRSGWPRRRRCRPRRSPACRPSSTASAPRPPRRRWPTAWRSASPASRPQRVARRQGRPHAAASRFPDPPPCGVTVARRRRAVARRTAGRRCSRTSPSTSAAASGCSCSASTAPARRACCASSPARPTADLGTFELRPQRQRRLLRPGARQPASRRVAARQHPRRGADRRRCSPRRSCAACSACSGLSGEKVFQERRHAVGRREDEAGAGDADGRPQQPAAARRADQQPRPAEPRVGRRRADDWQGTIIFVSHDTEFVEQLAPTRCC